VRRTGSWGILADCAVREVAQRSKRLWIAVLHQAIEDAKGNTRSAEKSASTVEGVQRDALIWIFHDQSRAGNSFHTICDLLDLDPGSGAPAPSPCARDSARLAPNPAGCGPRGGLTDVRLDQESDSAG
jgi:hypothetical protein